MLLCRLILSDFPTKRAYRSHSATKDIGTQAVLIITRLNENAQGRDYVPLQYNDLPPAYVRAAQSLSLNNLMAY